MEASPINLENIFLLRKANVWYTIMDGSWSNPDVWISNAIDKKNILLPQQGDTVYINHNVTIDIGNYTSSAAVNINNMYGAGTLYIPGGFGLSINGILNMSGAINMTGSGFNFLYLYGSFNSLGNLVNGTYSTVNYCCASVTQQPILPFNYQNLTTTCAGTAILTADTIINGTFNQQSNFECSSYGLTVNGSTTLGTVGACTFSKSSSTGSLLFVGAVDAEGGVNLTVGNPNIEFRGGLQIHTFSFMIGTGNVSFTTNSQTINCQYFIQIWNAPISIVGAITVTLTGSQAFQSNSSINGTVSGSTFNNSGILYLGINTTPMATGVFNYQYTSSSTLGYVFNGSATLPYSSYANLYIAGTGIKSLGSNTTTGQTLSNNGNLECNGFNLTVNGAFTNNGGGNFTASSFCDILFVGFAEFTISSGSGYVDLRTGNPNVEFRGGWDVHAFACYTGTGTFSFTTNNQTIGFSAYLGGVLAANFIISGITATYTGNTGVNMTALLNGSNSSSTFINNGIFNYANAAAPMSTGKLYCNQASNTFIYGLSGNQNITPPSDPTSPGYFDLTLNGSGAKTLLGIVSVKNTYTLTSPATLNPNGYNLTNP